MTGLNVISIGYYPGVLAAGLYVLNQVLDADRAQHSLIERLAIALALGMALGTLPLLALAATGLYSPMFLGAVGWLGCGWFAWKARELGWWRRWERPRWGDAIALVAVIALALWHADRAAESLLGGRDEGVYSNHGAHIARTGDLRAPMPHDGLDLDVGASILVATNPNGFFYDFEDNNIDLQFPAAFALQLAQAFGVKNWEGLFSLNPFLGAWNAILFIALARLWVSWRWAITFGILFALSPAQVWNSRVTLSEMLAQSWILGGLALALRGWRTSNTTAVMWGQGLACAAAFARVDAFLIPVTLCWGNAILALGSTSDLANDRACRDCLRRAQQVLAAMSAAAFTFCYYTSPGYFDDFFGRLGAMGALAVPAVGLHLLAGRDKPRRRLIDFIHSRPVFIITSVTLVGLALYAYFIRPHVEPFAQFESAHYGTRDYRENSLVDLSHYISVPVIAAAIAAVIVLLAQLGRGRNRKSWFILVPWLAMTLLYLHNPHISADHIWRIRRFNPVIIPGFILLAAIAVGYTEGVLRARWWRRLFRAAVWVHVLVFIPLALRPIADLKQYEGVLEAIRAISRRIPENALVVSDAPKRFTGPL